MKDRPDFEEGSVFLCSPDYKALLSGVMRGREFAGRTIGHLAHLVQPKSDMSLNGFEQVRRFDSTTSHICKRP
jgi:hypothetical protein